MHYHLLRRTLYSTLVFLAKDNVYAQNALDPASFVNLFIGTTNGGHVFPGATLPHGMVKVGMDTDTPGAQAGYDSDPSFNVTGFSSLHNSGTGGVFPSINGGAFQNCPTSLDNRKVLRKTLLDGTADDFASPGYFATNLTTGVRVEVTATEKASIQRHTFPPSTDGSPPRIVVDVTSAAGNTGTLPQLQINSTTGRVVGSGNFQDGFGPGRYAVFGCIDFAVQGEDGNGQAAAPVEWGIYLDSNAPILKLTSANQVYTGFGSQVGALLSFQPASSGNTVILVRTGVSFISTDQACSNAQEIADFEFDRVQSAARQAWNDVLSRVTVELGDGDDQEDMRELYYSSLYRTHIVPADYTNENPKWNSTEPYYDSFFCNWDTYRTLYSLMALHDPKRFAQVVRGMINVQQHEGWLPECRSATNPQKVQGGSNGDPIVGEFFVKYASQAATLGVSVDDLYTALLADAENLPPNWDLMGRQTDAWEQYNYLPADLVEPGGTPTKEVSRSLEYAFGDFVVSQVAKILNKTDDAEKYVSRAGNFVNHWDPSTTMPDNSGPSSLKGMMQKRLINETFVFTDPRHCSVHDPLRSGCNTVANFMDGFYEGSPLLYSQYVPHDNAKLIELQGGNESFLERLDFIIDNGYFDSSNEPGQQIPFMYHYVNRPGLSTQRSRQTIAQFFSLNTTGIPGNDDSGAMGSYAFFYLAGLYPLPGTRQFLLSSPFFPSFSFFNPVFNSTTTIKAVNFQSNPANGTGGSVFVKNVTIDGQPWKTNCFLEWDVFEKGSVVELELTDDITVPCGQTPDTLPPSLSTGGYD